MYIMDFFIIIIQSSCIGMDWSHKLQSSPADFNNNYTPRHSLTICDDQGMKQEFGYNQSVEQHVCLQVFRNQRELTK